MCSLTHGVPRVSCFVSCEVLSHIADIVTTPSRWFDLRYFSDSFVQEFWVRVWKKIYYYDVFCIWNDQNALKQFNQK